MGLGGEYMKVVTVKDRKQMRAFVRVPRTIHGKNPCYVPPIWMDENKAYTGRNNPILKNSDFELFLALDDDGTPIGRTIAYIDFTFNRYYGVSMGFFGAFECTRDAQAAKLLIEAAETWLRGKGMETIRGPIHPVAENWGFVYMGYDTPPVYMSPWNPEYYHDFFTDSGYGKAKDLMVYEADIEKGYALPARFDDFVERFLARYPGITIRRLDMRRIKDDARAIWEISNTALADNWGYVPLELPVMEDMLKKLKMIVDPDAVWMVEFEGKPVGYCLGFPDINILLEPYPRPYAASRLGAAAAGRQKAARLPAVRSRGQPRVAWQGIGRADVYPPLPAPDRKARAHGGQLHTRGQSANQERAGAPRDAATAKTYRIYEKALEA